MSLQRNRISQAPARKSTPTRQRALALVGLLVLSLLRCSSNRSPEFPLTALFARPGGLDPLKNTFNGDVGKVRLMLLLDPT